MEFDKIKSIISEVLSIDADGITCLLYTSDAADDV